MAAAINMGEKGSVRDKSLTNLLDGLVLAQKQDIKAYSSGHLNESNLHRHKSEEKQTTWKSGKKSTESMLPKMTLPSVGKGKKGSHDQMRDMMLSFCVGTEGNVSGVDKEKLDRKQRLRAKGQGKTPNRDSKPVLVEELTLPETMLPKKGEETFDQATLEDDTWSKQRSISRLTHHEFIVSHHGGVTKKDQFHQLKTFERDVLRKQDAAEQKVLSRSEVAERLEKKLQQDMELLVGHHGLGPDYPRIQVHSNVFEELIQESPTFGYMLRTIKTEYDNYLGSLLDGEIVKHKILETQVKQLSARGTSNSDTLAVEVANVSDLESRAKQLLEENESLRQELLMEESKADEPELRQPPKKINVRHEAASPDLADQIDELRMAIVAKLDSLQALKTTLRTECVPSTVCTHLEQCIKETEVEIQKLTSQKEFFERNIADMEKSLQGAIETADTTERDAKRVWKKITEVKRSKKSGKRGGGAHATDSGDDQDDSKKWEWYIS